jgi:hypothetical protein
MNKKSKTLLESAGEIVSDKVTETIEKTTKRNNSGSVTPPFTYMRESMLVLKEMTPELILLKAEELESIFQKFKISVKKLQQHYEKAIKHLEAAKKQIGISEKQLETSMKYGELAMKHFEKAKEHRELAKEHREASKKCASQVKAIKEGCINCIKEFNVLTIRFFEDNSPQRENNGDKAILEKCLIPISAALKMLQDLAEPEECPSLIQTIEPQILEKIRNESNPSVIHDEEVNLMSDKLIHE